MDVALLAFLRRVDTPTAINSINKTQQTERLVLRSSRTPAFDFDRFEAARTAVERPRT